jgi:hypothetical protein
MFEAGASVPYVMSQVGHADSATTLEIYSQVLERRERRTVGEAFDRLMRNAIPSGSEDRVEERLMRSGRWRETSQLRADQPGFGPQSGLPGPKKPEPINRQRASQMQE